jgi:hypothetical protein
MNAREVLPRSKVRVIAGRIAPMTQPLILVVDSHFEKNRAFIAGRFSALKPAKGAQGE